MNAFCVVVYLVHQLFSKRPKPATLFCHMANNDDSQTWHFWGFVHELQNFNGRNDTTHESQMEYDFFTLKIPRIYILFGLLFFKSPKLMNWDTHARPKILKICTVVAFIDNVRMCQLVAILSNAMSPLLRCH